MNPNSETFTIDTRLDDDGCVINVQNSTGVLGTYYVNFKTRNAYAHSISAAVKPTEDYLRFITSSVFEYERGIHNRCQPGLYNHLTRYGRTAETINDAFTEMFLEQFHSRRTALAVPGGGGIGCDPAKATPEITECDVKEAIQPFLTHIGYREAQSGEATYVYKDDVNKLIQSVLELVRK